MKTIATFLMLAFVGAALVAPVASAATPAVVNVDADILESCPSTTVERAICIVMGVAGPVIWLVWDETFYHVGVAVDLVVEECNHLTAGCPLIANLDKYLDATA